MCNVCKNNNGMDNNGGTLTNSLLKHTHSIFPFRPSISPFICFVVVVPPNFATHFFNVYFVCVCVWKVCIVPWAAAYPFMSVVIIIIHLRKWLLLIIPLPTYVARVPKTYPPHVFPCLPFIFVVPLLFVWWAHSHLFGEKTGSQSLQTVILCTTYLQSSSIVFWRRKINKCVCVFVFWNFWADWMGKNDKQLRSTRARKKSGPFLLSSLLVFLPTLGCHPLALCVVVIVVHKFPIYF